MNYTYDELAAMIDHSLLNPVMTDAVLAEGCELAARYKTATVCIKPYAVPLAAKLLQGTGVKVSTTIGFPHGGHLTAIKVRETEEAIAQGALELDMVCNIGKALSGDWAYVQDDIAAVVNAAHARNVLVKVIFENCYLQDEHKIKLCKICTDVAVDFVKTSTGYGTGGATIEDLTLMRAHAGAAVHVKAAGGVRDLDKLLEVRALGVTRVGATATAVMLDEARRRLKLPPLQGPQPTKPQGAHGIQY
jgi:deoxyribose-phosphate aldolase